MRARHFSIASLTGGRVRYQQILLPSTFTVLNLKDSGPGSLRQAVLSADATAGSYVIQFASGLSGIITLTGGSLTLTGKVSSQGPGAGQLAIRGNHASAATTSNNDLFGNLLPV